jgi:uncharacterized protein with LGFP repeats
MPVTIPYNTEPMNESPAPVVSATAPAGSPAADATNTCATALPDALDVLVSAVACAAATSIRTEAESVLLQRTYAQKQRQLCQMLLCAD